MDKINSFQKAVLLQYISVILIVLSFLIGASTSFKPTKGALPARQAATPLPNSLRSEIILENVFIENSDSINSDSLQPLRELLLNHNLDLHLNVSAQQGVEMKVVRLARVLREQGFWKDSFTVSGRLDPRGQANQTDRQF